MRITEKIEAVGEFIAWREENDSRAPLHEDLEVWAESLRAAKRAELFTQLHALALAAEAGAEDPANLSKFILEHVDG